jgi:hypothetical protein
MTAWISNVEERPDSVTSAAPLSTPFRNLEVLRPPVSLSPLYPILETIFSQPSQCHTSWFLYSGGPDDPRGAWQTPNTLVNEKWVHRGWRELWHNKLFDCFPSELTLPGNNAATFSGHKCFVGYTTAYQEYNKDFGDTLAVCCPTYAGQTSYINQ